MPALQLLTPCLWFDGQALDAAEFYTTLFPDSGIDAVTRTPGAGQDIHGRAEGSVFTVSFHLAGQPMMGLNGGPAFSFTPAVSFVVQCADQAEIDRLWDALAEGGDPAAQQCGWLADRFGLSWQIVPEEIGALMSDPDPARAARGMDAVLAMKKIDIAALRRAVEG